MASACGLGQAASRCAGGLGCPLASGAQAVSTVAVLFARADSNYKTIPGCDVWDADRDARRWPGGAPVVAHPPCRAWGKLRQFAKPRPDEKELALFAVEKVRTFGGVLEHPAGSTLWTAAGLPRPQEFLDNWGGWTLEAEQFHWGHRAAKKTWFYIVGKGPNDLPPMPNREGRPTHCIAPTRHGGVRLPTVTKPEREHTPVALALWLVDVDRGCKA